MTDDAMYALASRLNYEDARRYLESRGWSRATSRRADVGIFRLADHEAILPMDTSLRDYPSAMVLLARNVGEAESRSMDRVLADLASANRDRHRPALVSNQRAPGVSLDAAAAMLDGVQRALLASACSVLQPRRFHPRMTLSDAEAFIAETRFVTTEVGSFVMVVETPTDVDGTQPDFGRASSLMLIRSLAHVARSLRTGTRDRIANPEAGEPQISANLCDAVLRMAPPDEGADLRFEVTWSPLVALSGSVPGTVTIDRHMYESIEQLATELRPTESNAPSTHVCIVKELKGAPGPSGRAEGETVFTVVQEDGTPLRAKAQLTPDQYRTAVDAHAAPSPVVVEAELHRVRRGYELRRVALVEHWGHEPPK